MNKNNWESEFDKRFLSFPEDKIVNGFAYDEIKVFIQSLLDKERKQEIKFLRRIDLDFKVIHCECGEEWKNTDPHNLVKERIKLLTNKPNV